MKKLLGFLIAVFASISSFSQDIIILKTGDEIKSKVIEITTDIVKYKKWANQEGPVYTSNKSEVFMIKYENGTKDVFNTSTATSPNSAQTSILNNGSKFIGTWFHKRYDGNNNKTTMTISKPGEDFLVDYRKLSRGGGYDSFYNTDGSFKEMGRLDGNSIVINSFIKLSLMDDNTILMNSEEFRKSSTSNQANNTISNKLNYIGYYNNKYSDGEYKVVNGVYYKSNSAQIKSVIFDVNGVIHNNETADLIFKGGQSKNQFLTSKITIDGFKRINGRYNYDVSLFAMYNGEQYDKKENMDWDSLSDPLVAEIVYNTPSLKAGASNSHTFYMSFFIKDKYSTAVIQGFYKYTLVP